MLDLKTVLVVSFAVATLQTLVLVFVWRAWRRLYELKFLAAGFAAIAIGLLLMIARGPAPAAWIVVLDNLIIKLGLVLLAEGLARFLGQPRYSWIGIGLLAFQLVTWSAAMTWVPGDIAPRIHTSTLFTVIMMSVMCLALLRDRTQPRLLRWITVAILAEYMISSIAQSAIEIMLPAMPRDVTILADRNAWYLLQGVLFLVAFFACLLFMVGARLSADLRSKNAALSDEIEHRRRLEIRLNASLDNERALREEQSDMMNVVGHEFRTPLAIIRNAKDMIGLRGDLPPAAQQRLDGIGEALDRLFVLIDRFMSNSNDSPFQPETIGISTLLADVRLHYDLTGRGERLLFKPADSDLTLFADPDMLGTVLITLIDNALKYSTNGQTVTIDHQQHSDHVLLRVHDRGIGIPRGDMPKIGRRFFRASNTQAGTGTGLGLYNARKLLDYHGGALQLLANNDCGITAHVRLPLTIAAASETATEDMTA